MGWKLQEEYSIIRKNSGAEQNTLLSSLWAGKYTSEKHLDYGAAAQQDLCSTTAYSQEVRLRKLICSNA